MLMRDIIRGFEVAFKSTRAAFAGTAEDQVVQEFVKYINRYNTESLMDKEELITLSKKVNDDPIIRSFLHGVSFRAFASMGEGATRNLADEITSHLVYGLELVPVLKNPNPEEHEYVLLSDGYRKELLSSTEVQLFLAKNKWLTTFAILVLIGHVE